MKDILLEIAKNNRSGIVYYNGRPILVRFYEKDGEFVGAFYVSEKEFSEGTMFSEEIYRSVGALEKMEEIVIDIEEHIKSLFD